MTQIWTAQGGVLKRRGQSDLAVGTSRPTGPGYVRYEDLYVSGDDVNAAMARLTTPAIITFPTGVFEVSDFNYKSSPYCIVPPTICTGLWGSGQGDLSGTADGTYFRIKANTSTKASQVPTQGTGQPTLMVVLMQINAQSTVTWNNFRVVGTEQGHIYHGAQVYNPGGAVTVTDVTVNGWYGNNGAPPGETFGLAIHGAPSHIVTRYTGDGRRSVGGPGYGAVGFTSQNCVQGEWHDCVTKFCQTASGVFYQTANCKTYNHVSGDPGGETYYTAGLGGWGFNHELTTGSQHYNPVYNVPAAGANNGVHVTHSNDSRSFTYNGTTFAVDNGTLAVYNPTFKDIWGSGKFYVQSWTPYGNGDTMSTAPLVTQADGTTHLPYIWVHNTHNLIT